MSIDSCAMSRLTHLLYQAENVVEPSRTSPTVLSVPTGCNCGQHGQLSSHGNKCYSESLPLGICRLAASSDVASAYAYCANRGPITSRTTHCCPAAAAAAATGESASADWFKLRHNTTAARQAATKRQQCWACKLVRAQQEHICCWNKGSQPQLAKWLLSPAGQGMPCA